MSGAKWTAGTAGTNLWDLSLRSANMPLSGKRERRCTMRTSLTIAGTALMMAMIAGTVCAQSGPGPCDRACLEGFAERYLDAAIAHDPGLLPLAKNVKFTENGQRLVLPDAHWKTMIGKGNYRLFVTDPEAGQVAFIATIREEGDTKEGTGAPIAVRLRAKDRQITEIETLVIRQTTPAGPGSKAAPVAPQGPAANMEKLGVPHHLMTDPVPPAERMSRADLIRTANMYFSGMEKNDGKGVYPFTDDCDRFENGTQTTNMPLREGQTRPDSKTSSSYSGAWGCKEQFESGLIHFVWRIHDRRFVAVDPERGLVFSFVFFDHALGRDRTFQTPDGRTVTAGPVDPYTWEIAELFRIEKGKIRRIEAILTRSPYAMNSGWSSWEDGLSSTARDVTKSSGQ
jgi:hypothetical protein